MRTHLSVPAGYAFRRSVFSHGWCDLPPFTAADTGDWVATVVAIPGGGAARMTLHRAEEGGVVLETRGSPPLATQRALRTAARRMLGLDLDLPAATAHLAADPVLGPLIARRPGLRVPGAWAPFEAGVHAIVGQHRGAAATAALLGHLVRRHGTPIPGLRHGLTHAFPAAPALM